MQIKQTFASADLRGKRVLVRVDFNVPLKDGVVGDDTRVVEVLPTIKLLQEKGARIIVLSHLGRPAGIGYEKAFSLEPVAKHFSKLLGSPVRYVNDIVGSAAHAAADALQDGEVLLCENLRFDPREKKCDPDFVRELASLGDVFVNEAFGAVHRAHASISALAEHLPTYAGLLLAKEVSTITAMFDEPAHPFVAVLGGSKVSDKIGIIDFLSEMADVVLIGGGMCFTFERGRDHTTGASLVQEDWIERSQQMLQTAQERGCNVVLPQDYVVADSFSPDAATQIVSASQIPDGWMGLDIGPETRKAYAAHIAQAKTILWNGPMGVFEMEAFEAGTRAVAEAIAANKTCVSLVGGGDSVAAIKKFGLSDEVSFISTGGGSTMELIKGKPLPGVEVIPDAAE